MNVRASVEVLDDGFGIVLGAAWRRDCGVAPGDVVDVVLMPEGPQRDDLAEDVRAALAAETAAGASFDGLAQFYRRAFLRWIDAAKRRPEERDRRIAEMIGLLQRGENERPEYRLAAVARWPDCVLPAAAHQTCTTKDLPRRTQGWDAVSALEPTVIVIGFDLAAGQAFGEDLLRVRRMRSSRAGHRRVPLRARAP
jgi:hypothetical protein